jgi:MFS family permease
MKAGEVESSYAWLRLLACLGIGTAGSVGLWSYVVALPAVQAEFGVARAEASHPYTATMIGFGNGAILLGRISDRFSIVAATVSGAILIGIGYVVSGLAPNLSVLALASVVLGMGS